MLYLKYYCNTLSYKLGTEVILLGTISFNDIALFITFHTTNARSFNCFYRIAFSSMWLILYLQFLSFLCIPSAIF